MNSDQISNCVNIMSLFNKILKESLCTHLLQILLVKQVSLSLL